MRHYFIYYRSHSVFRAPWLLTCWGQATFFFWRFCHSQGKPVKIHVLLLNVLVHQLLPADNDTILLILLFSLLLLLACDLTLWQYHQCYLTDVYQTLRLACVCWSVSVSRTAIYNLQAEGLPIDCEIALQSLGTIIRQRSMDDWW